jgi:hypothetical protein
MALCLLVNAYNLLESLRAKQTEKDNQVFLLGLPANSYLKKFSQLGHCMNFLRVIRSEPKRTTNAVSSIYVGSACTSVSVRKVHRRVILHTTHFIPLVSSMFL